VITERDFSLEDTPKTRELKSRGFVVEPFLSEGDVQALLDLHRATFPEVDGDIHLTAFLTDPAMKKRLFEAVQNIVGEKLKTLVPGFSLLYASFVTKKAQVGRGRVAIHQDLSVVEHDKHLGLNAWVPLCDVDHTNGCLKVVAGSHAFGHTCANPRNPAPYNNVLNILDEYAIDVPMKQGQALLFDSRVLHKSDGNTTNKPRIALLLNVYPSSATPKYYQWNRDNPDQLELYEVTTSFLQNFSPNSYEVDAEAKGARLIRLFDYQFECTKADDLPRILPTAHLPKKPHPAPVAAARANSAPDGNTHRRGQLAPEVKSQTNSLALRKVLSSLLRRD
jgi:ectoine hydroxylase-related dioxygenase (phytanoyl-CoA dioxygenase family)